MPKDPRPVARPGRAWFNFDRLMFQLLIPGVALGAAAGTVAIGVGEFDVSSLIFAVFAYILLGSLTLNAWLYWRHPDSLWLGTLSRSASVSTALIYSLSVAWIACVVTQKTIQGEISTSQSEVWAAINVAISALLAVTSIVSFLAVMSRSDSFAKRPTRKLEPLERRHRIGIIFFCLTAALFLAGYANSSINTVGGGWFFILMFLGLPWSHPIALIAIFAGWHLAAGGQALYWALIAPIAVNIALGVLFLISTRWRNRAINWFFRLGTERKPFEPPSLSREPQEQN